MTNLPLYNCLGHIWTTSCKHGKIINELEEVQRSETRMVEGLEGYKYEDCSSILGLTSLETRFSKVDLIEVFKILRGFKNVNPDRIFRMIGDGVRLGHCFKLFKKRSSLDVRWFEFASRVYEWNKLGCGIVSDCFKDET